jgi:hypothetical protein
MEGRESIRYFEVDSDRDAVRVSDMISRDKWCAVVFEKDSQ